MSGSITPPKQSMAPPPCVHCAQPCAARVEDVDGRRAIAASHSPLHTTRRIYAIVPWRDIIFSPTCPGQKKLKVSTTTPAYRLARATAGGGRWTTMRRDEAQSHRTASPSLPIGGIASAGPGRQGAGDAAGTLTRGMGRRARLWSVILGWDDWASPKGAAPPPLRCAEDTQNGLLASAGGQAKCAASKAASSVQRCNPGEPGRRPRQEAGLRPAL